MKMTGCTVKFLSVCAIPMKQLYFAWKRLRWALPENDSSVGAKLVYESKDGNRSKTLDALDWPRKKTAGCKH